MTQPIRTFASDNFSAVDPKIMDYLSQINRGHEQAYGSDTITAEAEKLFVEAFGEGTRTAFVPTGTGANILSMRLLLAKPYEAVVTTTISHIFEEETGALSAMTGAHIFTIPHKNGLIDVNTLEKDVELRKSLGFHSAVPRVVSIASTTEYGTYYTIDEIKNIAAYCHANDLLLHVDGCRLPNVVAALGCTLKEYTRDAGVDILSFGGAKNGLMNAEAVVILSPLPDIDLRRMQKQAVQLVSKMRYMSGQFVPYLKEAIWRKNAEHSNSIAQHLAKELKRVLGDRVTFTQPISTNQVFCILPTDMTTRLRDRGYEFYDWNSPGEVRFVTSWDNTLQDVENFIKCVRE